MPTYIQKYLNKLNIFLYIFIHKHVVCVYLFCKATSFIVRSGFLYAAAKLRALCIQLPGRLCEDLPIP